MVELMLSLVWEKKQEVLYGRDKQKEGRYVHGDMAALLQAEMPTNHLSSTKDVCNK